MKTNILIIWEGGEESYREFKNITNFYNFVKKRAKEGYILKELKILNKKGISKMIIKLIFFLTIKMNYTKCLVCSGTGQVSLTTIKRPCGSCKKGELYNNYS